MTLGMPICPQEEGAAGEAVGVEWAQVGLGRAVKKWPWLPKTGQLPPPDPGQSTYIARSELREPLPLG